MFEETSNPGPKEYDLGTYEDILSGECSAHRRLVMGTFQNSKVGPNQRFRITTLSTQAEYDTIIIKLSNSNFFSSGMELVKQSSAIGSTGHGRILDPCWIDGSIFHQWNTHCSVHHNRSCSSNSVSSWLPPPQLGYLIDTRQYRLVPARQEFRYVALSYVWGESNVFKTQKHNLELLLQPNSLSPNNPLHISRTITDAMHVVHLLKERYLWVDSLCIVQDDEHKKHDQIRGMASIYANASVTIIAAGGDNADFGLRGLRGVSLPRTLTQKIYKIGGREIIHHIPENRYSTVWYTRAWTFQEHVFSRRRLIFQDNTVRWECDNAAWTEEVDVGKSFFTSYDEATKFRKMFTTTFPDFRTYGFMVSTFMARQLTFQEDVLAAFAGLTTALTYTFDGGFLCGLPVLAFDVALLWLPNATLKRRIDFRSPLKSAILPSWAWAGWVGSIGLTETNFVFPGSSRTGRVLRWYTAFDHAEIAENFRKELFQTTPILQWFIYDAENSDRTPICSKLDEYKQRYLSGNDELPNGWIRHRDPSFGQGDCTRSHFFTHESIPNEHFFCPIPLVDRTQPQIIRQPVAFISCRAQRAFVRIGERLKPIYIICGPLFIVRDEGGAWAGVVQLHEDLPPDSGVKFELAAISLGSARNSSEELVYAQCPEWDHEERPKTGRDYEWYNVLWIEWKDGIAYRKGLGRIAKGAWESLDLEWIDLILG